LLPDDESPDMLRLYPTPWTGNGGYRHAEITPKPPSGPGFGAPDAIVPGAVQRFEAGRYLVFARGLVASSARIYAVSGEHIWSEFINVP
jgi:hypothetical protein